MLVGKLGEHAYAGDCHMSVDEGYQASRLVALNLISTLQVRKPARPDRRDRCNQNQSSSLPQAELGDLEKVVKVVNQKVVQQDIRHAFAAAKRSAGKRSAAPKPGAMALPVRPYKRRDGVGA